VNAEVVTGSLFFLQFPSSKEMARRDVCWLRWSDGDVGIVLGLLSVMDVSVCV
jgi:hypothetical protein